MKISERFPKLTAFLAETREGHSDLCRTLDDDQSPAYALVLSLRTAWDDLQTVENGGVLPGHCGSMFHALGSVASILNGFGVTELCRPMHGGAVVSDVAGKPELKAALAAVVNEFRAVEAKVLR